MTVEEFEEAIQGCPVINNPEEDGFILYKNPRENHMCYKSKDGKYTAVVDVPEKVECKKCGITFETELHEKCPICGITVHGVMEKNRGFEKELLDYQHIENEKLEVKLYDKYCELADKWDQPVRLNKNYEELKKKYEIFRLLMKY